VEGAAGFLDRKKKKKKTRRRRREGGGEDCQVLFHLIF
jgi:hypothetical protein